MDKSESPNKNPSRRRLVLGLMLLAAIGLSGAAWNWNRRVHSLDPSIVIRTESEAVGGARMFLAAAQISRSGFELSHTSRITKNRLKGQVVWRIVWLPKQDVTLTNELVVLANERGCFYTDVMRSTNEGVSIQGNLTNITRHHFVSEWPKGQ